MEQAAGNRLHAVGVAHHGRIRYDIGICNLSVIIIKISRARSKASFTVGS